MNRRRRKTDGEKVEMGLGANERADGLYLGDVVLLNEEEAGVGDYLEDKKKLAASKLAS